MALLERWRRFRTVRQIRKAERDLGREPVRGDIVRLGDGQYFVFVPEGRDALNPRDFGAVSDEAA
jgi:hypothetical protein